MIYYALFEGQTLVGGPQYPDPGGWVEVEVEEVPAGTLREWDFTGERPRLRTKVLSSEERAIVEGETARAKRNRLLLESDWTDTYSAPGRLGAVVYQEWQDYRQGLRDISSQTGFPTEIVWPIAPSAS